MPKTRLPRISVITPSFNQARFLPFNLDSVSGQTFRDYEQLIYDPGSTDGSREIARNAGTAELIAEPDEGQSDAICKGFERARGDILTWLNSDDVYASSETLKVVADRFAAPDAPDVVYGRVDFIDEEGNHLRDGFVNPKPETLLDSFHHQVGILQPGVFLHRRVYEAVGGPPLDMDYTLDYEYWVRIARAGFRWVHVPNILALHRWWGGMKTAGRRGESYKEHLETVKRHFGYVHVAWAERYANFLVHGADGIITTQAHEDGDPLAVGAATREILEQYNTDYDTLHLLTGEDAHPNMAQTAAAMRELGIPLQPRGRPVAAVDVIDAAPRRPHDAGQPEGWHSYVTNLEGVECVGYGIGGEHWLFDREVVEDALEQGASRFRDLARDRQRRGQDTCIIVGNGPSLRQIDLTLLEGQDVFISNFAFISDDLRQNATYLTVVNRLVAEQGCHDFNVTGGLTKIVPYWLASHLRHDDDTIVLDANIRPEFSTDPTEHVSWRSTVSFFNLQLAYGLGYRRVLLIGFDHYYQQTNVSQEGDLIVQEAPDLNHFDPNYFKGKAWQAADVENMGKMYELARTAFEADGREVVNCTVGGHLEVFRRSTLEHELSSGSPLNVARTPRDFPRLLIVDSTRVGQLCATGQLKETLLQGWPPAKLLQIWEHHSADPTLHVFRPGDDPNARPEVAYSEDELIDLCRRFEPDVIYVRPTDYPRLLAFTQQMTDALRVPVVVHMMDDWPERLRHEQPRLFPSIDRLLRGLLAAASDCLAISPHMARAYGERYGRAFEVVANAVDLEAFPALRAPAGDWDHERPFTLRYLGGLADDMNFQSVEDVARQVSELAKTRPISFEIYVTDAWIEKARLRLSRYQGVTVHPTVPDVDSYRHLLSSADALLVAYNFDDRSTRYVRYSMANKLPECLASGTPVLAYGPRDVATIDYLATNGAARIVSERNPAALEGALTSLLEDIDQSAHMAAKGRDVVATRHDLGTTRSTFQGALRAAAKSGQAAQSSAEAGQPPAEAPRDAGRSLGQIRAQTSPTKRGRRRRLPPLIRAAADALTSYPVTLARRYPVIAMGALSTLMLLLTVSLLNRGTLLGWSSMAAFIAVFQIMGMVISMGFSRSLAWNQQRDLRSAQERALASLDGRLRDLEARASRARPSVAHDRPATTAGTTSQPSIPARRSPTPTGTASRRHPRMIESLKLLRDRGVPVNSVVDVGVQHETPALREVFHDRPHILVEPIAEYFPRIRENYRGMDITLIEAAASDQTGSVHLQTQRKTHGDEVSHSFIVSAATSDSREVPSTTLDKLLEVNPPPRPFLLKIDVEGRDVPTAILRGARESLSDASVIVMEVTVETLPERLAALNDAGFTVWDIVDLAYYDDCFWQADFILVRRSLLDELPHLRPMNEGEFLPERWQAP